MVGLTFILRIQRMKSLRLETCLGRRSLFELDYVTDGQVPKWTKGADCKSAALWLPRFESLPAHQIETAYIRLGRLQNDDREVRDVAVRRLVPGRIWPASREVLVGSPWAGVAQW